MQRARDTSNIRYMVAVPQRTYGGDVGTRWREWSRSGHALAPGKGLPVHIVQEAGWAREPDWTQKLEEKSFASPEDRTWIVLSSSP
jgi:hypothetical protein